MRIWQWGVENGAFDCPTLTTPVGTASASVGSAWSQITSSKVRGPWSKYAYTLLSADNFIVNFGSNVTELFLGYGCNFGGSGANTKFSLRDATGTTHLEWFIQSGSLRFERNGTFLGTAGAVTPGVGQYVEIRATIADAGGILQVKQDGRLTLDFSGDTRNGSNANIRTFCVYGGGFGTADPTLDDMVANDTNNSDGAGNNSWPGDVAIIGLVPTAAGDAAQLSRGGADSGANWSQVEEIPPNGDTDYVYSSTVDQRDLYNLADLDSTFADIQAVSFIFSAKKDNAGNGNVAAAVKQGATEVTLSDLPVPSGAYKALGEIKSKDPTDSTAWTRSKVNSLQAGPKVR